jgi:peptide/nickel transport system substrate-binding protein
MRKHEKKAPQHDGGSGLTRREFLARAAVATGTVVAGRQWAQPLAAFAQARPSAQVIKFGLSTPILTLDGRYSTTAQNDAITDTIYDSLLFRQFPTGKMEVVPRLATSWERTGDTAVAFKVRRGVTFANGEPVNAEAVKYSIDSVWQKSFNAVRSYLLPSVDGVDIVDEYTVRIRTSARDRTISTNMTYIPIMPPKMAQQLGRGMGTQASGTGPYQPTEFVSSQLLRLRPNEKYWATPKPGLGGIDILLAVDDGTRAAALLAGDVHIINNLPVDQIDRVRKSDRHDVRASSTARIVYCGMRQDRGPLKDVRVRQAFNYAVDKEAIVRNVLRGQASVANSPVASVLPFANPNAKAYPYNPARAKALLAEAGYPSNFTPRFAVPTGRFLADRATGEAVAGYLSEIGVKIEVETPEWGVLFNEVFGKGPQSRYDMWMSSQGAITEDSLLRLRFHSSFNQFWMAYQNNEIDALIDAGLLSIDDNHARLVYAQLQNKLMADAPWIFLHHVNTVFGVDRRLRGFNARPDEFIYFHEASFA